MPLAGQPFAALGAQIEDALAGIGRAARVHGGRVAMIGILPTLAEADLESSLLTNTHRYCALSTALRRCRRGPFHVGIEGKDRLAIASDDVAMEGANTSFQIHLRVPKEEFADAYNAAQIATAPALAAAGNSPLFLGHRLWDETRSWPDPAQSCQLGEDRRPRLGAVWRARLRRAALGINTLHPIPTSRAVTP